MSNDSQNIQPTKVISYYKGIAEQEALDGLLEGLESKLDQTEGAKKIKKKVYNVSIEMLQNAFQYVCHDGMDEPWLQVIVFEVNADEKGFKLSAQNYVHESSATLLSNKISEINTLDSEELKTRYRGILKENEFSDRGGAGLGFYDMARKSGQKLDFSFDHDRKPWALFTLNIQIPF